MIGTMKAPGSVMDWLEFFDPEDGTQMFRVNMSFIMSGYGCIFTKGCPGLLLEDKPDYLAGCCHRGVAFVDEDDFNHVAEQVKLLTADDWDHYGYKSADGDKWYTTLKGKPVKTKKVNTRCIFGNGFDGSAGKPGCAFHHLAERLGVPTTETKPDTCWRHPIGFDNKEVPGWIDLFCMSIYPFDATTWGGLSDEDTQEIENDNAAKHGRKPQEMKGYIGWYCTDTPDAYTQQTPVYQRFEAELRKGMGNSGYEELVRLIDEKGIKMGDVFPMPGAMLNEGRPLLPLMVKERTGHDHDPR